MMLDKFGIRVVAFIASLLVTLGQTIFAFGVSVRSFYIALIGRAVFGCGGENLDMSQSVLVISWFAGRELSMAYTISSCTSLVADVLNDNLNPFVYNQAGLVTALWIGCLVCLASFVLSFFVLRLNQKRQKTMAVVGDDNSKEQFRFSHIKKLGKPFWVLVFNITCIESCVYCFGFIASGYLQDRFGYDLQTAGSVMSMTFLISAVSSPLFGICVDRVGKRPLFNISSCLLITSFHLTLMLVPDSNDSILPVFIFLLIGAGYSINLATSWPCVPLIVDESLIGTAYGIVFSNGNFNLVVFPVLIGYIQENTHQQNGYFWVSCFLAFLGLVGVFTGCWLHYYDMHNGKVLSSAKAFEMKKKAESQKDDPISTKENFQVLGMKK
jgi:MFS family permease